MQIGGKVVTFRYVLKNGDQVEVMTSTTQKPKHEWLNIVKTSRAKAKIRMALKDQTVKDGAYAREMFERRLKNRKIEFEESAVSHLIKKLGFKEANDFYRKIADGTLDVNQVIDKYQELQQHDANISLQQQSRSAEGFSYENPNEEIARYDLDEDFSIETAVEFGRLYRRSGEWKFEAMGIGNKGGLQALVNKYQ